MSVKNFSNTVDVEKLGIPGHLLGKVTSGDAGKSMVVDDNGKWVVGNVGSKQVQIVTINRVSGDNFDIDNYTFSEIYGLVSSGVEIIFYSPYLKLFFNLTKCEKTSSTYAICAESAYIDHSVFYAVALSGSGGENTKRLVKYEFSVISRANLIIYGGNTLTAGQTTITFTISQALISNKTFIEVYAIEDRAIHAKNITVSGTTVTAVFDVQESDIHVAAIVVNT